MITRIEVDGFKSLRAFAMDLEPFTVLIGPNSAGKSNVLDALALLSRLARMPVAEAFKRGRGKSIDQFSRHGREVASASRFAIEILEPWRSQPVTSVQNRFRYELTIERHAMRAGVERLVIGDERLVAMRREDDTWVVAHPELVAHAHYGNAGDAYVREDKDGQVALQWLAQHPALTPLAGAAAHALVWRNLALCQVLDLDGAHVGGPSEKVDSGGLSPDASNLPTVLAELPPDVLGEIRADLVALVPGIASFDVALQDDEVRLDFELSGGERLPGRLVSTGTLRILALLTALRTDPQPHTLCIEEPENGIYPGRLRALIELLLQATSPAGDEPSPQLVLTTHSPVALAALRSNPRHLRFVDMVRREGARVTRVRTVGVPLPGDRGRLTVSPREIDALLHAARSEGTA